MKTLALLTATILLASCSRDIQNNEAVKAGVVDYLKARTAQTGLDMNMMQVDVTSISFQANEARATVSFRPKTGDATPMMMNYTLDRKGNKWVVRGRTENGVSPHGAGGMPPPQADGPGDGQAPKPLPPGHPPLDSMKDQKQ